MPSQLEYHHQRHFIQWVWTHKNHPELPGLDLIFAIPNGADLTGGVKGNRRAAISQGAKLKKEGARAGVPDLFLPVPYVGLSVYHGLFIEFKRPAVDGKPKGQPSAKQKEYIKRLQDQGYKVVIVYTWIEAKEAVLAYYGIK